jgi:hypothetical protein
VPVAEGDRLEEKLETHKSFMTTYRMYKDSERELRFPLAVSVSYRTAIVASTAKWFEGTRRAIWAITRPHRSNTATASGQRSNSAIGCFGVHER